VIVSEVTNKLLSRLFSHIGRVGEVDVKVFKGRRGITGLETAIILIAFVIVASVFAFTMLNMGFLTTQTAQSTIQAGTQQATSAMQLAGSVIAYDNNDDDRVDMVEIYIKLSPGRQAVDLSEGKLIVSYTSSRGHWVNVYNSTKYQNACNVVEVTGDGDMLLERGELFKITLNLTAIDPTNKNAELVAYDWFKVELKPPVGAVLSIERMIPANVDAVMDLDAVSS